MALLYAIMLLLSCCCCWPFTEAGARLHKRQASATSKIQDISSFRTAVGPDKEVDLILLLDRSKSIGKEEFYRSTKKLTQALLTQYVTVHPDYARIAVITFAKDTTLVLDHISQDPPIHKCDLFGGPNPLWDLVTFIDDPDKIPATNVKQALQDAQKIFENSTRSQVARVIFLITDGSYSNLDDPQSEAVWMKDNMGVVIYGAGVGSWLKFGNVQILTSKDKADSNINYYESYNTWSSSVSHQSSSDPWKLTSYSSGTRPLWVQVDGALCADPAALYYGCYCDVHRGVTERLCDGGYTLDNVTGLCTECPQTTYRDDLGDNTCHSCPPDHNTTTGGATGRTQCLCTEAVCEDPCSPNPCQSEREVCESQSNTTSSWATCTCLPGWEGSNCSLNTDDCVDHGCLNGAVCHDMVGAYACVCARWGFQGRHCEVNIDECGSPQMCENSANCTDQVNNFLCTCPAGWVGKYCQDVAPPTPVPTIPVTRSTTPVTSNPNPTPRTTTPGRIQTPDPEHTTTDATNIVNKPTQSGIVLDQTTLIIIYVAGSVGGVLILILIIVWIVLCTRRSKRKTRDEEEKKQQQQQQEEVRNISHKFSGVWKKKTVRGRGSWMEEDVKVAGLPSVPPPRHQPDLIHATSMDELRDDEYTVFDFSNQAITERTGMDGWQQYLLELVQRRVLTAGTIVSLGSDRRAMTDSWNYSSDEIFRLEMLLDEKATDVPLLVQDGEFHVQSNNGSVAVGHTIGSWQASQSIAIGRTKNYLIVGLDDGTHEDGRCLREVEYITDHICGENY